MTYTDASKRAVAKYRKEKRARMELEMSPEEMEILKKAAEKTQESRSGLIRRLIREEAGKLGLTVREN